MVFQLTSWSLNWMTFDLGWPLTVKLGTMEVILSNIWIHFTFGKMFTLLSNIWTDFSLIHFHFWSTFHMHWHIKWPHMTSYWLNKRFWAMFEPTSTWPNFAFGQLLTWIGSYNDHIYDFLWAKQAILSNIWTDSNFTWFYFWSTFTWIGT